MQLILNLLKQKLQSGFARDVFKLSSGTAIAQLISFAVLPILTRLFSPDEFGQFALYATVVWLCVVVATLQYEHLVMQPRTRTASYAVFYWIIFCALLFSSMLILVITIILSVNDYVATNILSKIIYSDWIFILPFAVFLISINQSLRYLLISENRFGLISYGTFGRAASLNLVSISLGYFRLPTSAPHLGLMFGQIAGYVTDNYIMARGLFKSVVKHPHITKYRVLAVARYYFKRALSLTYAHLVKTGYARFPIFIVGAAGGAQAIGFYALVDRIVAAPVMLVAQPIGDVFRNRASNLLHSNGCFDSLLLRTVGTAAILSAPVFILGIVMAPDAFAFIFGDEWRIAGEYASILLIGELANFIFIPITSGAIILGMDKYIICWHSGRLLANILLFISVSVFLLDVLSILYGLAFIKILFHLIDFVVIYFFSRKKVK